MKKRKETPSHLLSSKFCMIFKYTYSEEKRWRLFLVNVTEEKKGGKTSTLFTNMY